MSCPTNNPKRPATVPTHILEVANLTFDTASPYTRPRSHIGGSGAHRGRDRLLCAGAHRETALVCATTVRYQRHTIGRSLARRQRLRPSWVPNSQHKAHKGRRAVARAQTLQWATLTRAARLATRSPLCAKRSTGARGSAGQGSASPMGLPQSYPGGAPEGDSNSVPVSTAERSRHRRRHAETTPRETASRWTAE